MALTDFFVGAYDRASSHIRRVGKFVANPTNQFVFLGGATFLMLSVLMLSVQAVVAQDEKQDDNLMEALDQANGSVGKFTQHASLFLQCAMVALAKMGKPATIEELRRHRDEREKAQFRLYNDECLAEQGHSMDMATDAIKDVVRASEAIKANEGVRIAQEAHGQIKDVLNQFKSLVEGLQEESDRNPNFHFTYGDDDQGAGPPSPSAR